MTLGLRVRVASLLLVLAAFQLVAAEEQDSKIFGDFHRPLVGDITRDVIRNTSTDPRSIVVEISSLFAVAHAGRLAEEALSLICPFGFYTQQCQEDLLDGYMDAVEDVTVSADALLQPNEFLLLTTNKSTNQVRIQKGAGPNAEVLDSADLDTIPIDLAFSMSSGFYVEHLSDGGFYPDGTSNFTSNASSSSCSGSACPDPICWIVPVGGGSMSGSSETRMATYMNHAMDHAEDLAASLGVELYELRLMDVDYNRRTATVRSGGHAIAEIIANSSLTSHIDKHLGIAFSQGAFVVAGAIGGGHLSLHAFDALILADPPLDGFYFTSAPFYLYQQIMQLPPFYTIGELFHGMSADVLKGSTAWANANNFVRSTAYDYDDLDDQRNPYHSDYVFDPDVVEVQWRPRRYPPGHPKQGQEMNASENVPGVHRHEYWDVVDEDPLVHAATVAEIGRLIFAELPDMIVRHCEKPRRPGISIGEPGQDYPDYGGGGSGGSGMGPTTGGGGPMCNGDGELDPGEDCDGGVGCPDSSPEDPWQWVCGDDCKCHLIHTPPGPHRL